MFKKLGPKLNATHSPNFDHICEPKPLDVAPQEKTTIESTPALTPALTSTSTSTSTTEQAFSPVQIPLALPQTATQKEEIFHESEIGFVTTGGYIRHDLDTIFGGNATLVSPLLPGINIHWREKLSENWSTEMQFEYQNTKIQAPPNTEVIGISPHTKFGLNGLKTFAGNSKSDNESTWKAGFGIHYGTEPMATKISNGLARENAPQVTRILSSVENDLPMSLQKRLVLRTQTSLWYTTAAQQSSYKILSGYGYEVNTKLVRHIVYDIHGTMGASYSHSIYSSSLGQHTNTNISYFFGLVVTPRQKTP